MKLLLVFLTALMLAALDWAALHDILKGEPDVSNEYAIVALSVVAFIALFLFWRKHRKQPA